LNRFYLYDTLRGAVAEAQTEPERTLNVGSSAGVEDRENAIGESGFRGSVRSPVAVLAVLALSTFLLLAGCGGGQTAQEAQPPPTPPKETAPGVPKGDPKGGPVGNVPGGSTVEAKTDAETLEGSPFELNQRQPVPPDFRAAYQRKALIVVAFSKEDPDSTRGIEYPQGMKPDEQVNQALGNLRADYPQIEFFTYDITEPGDAEASEDLGRGEYGTLAAQLEVGYTPFVAMLAPRGEGYVVENLYQGYVDRGVLDQALFDLTRSGVGGNSSDIDVVLDRVELTESGGGIEYVTVTNQGDDEANLSGFSLRSQDPETGEVDDSGGGIRVEERVSIAPGETVSIGREPGITDADGREAVGTFAGGDALAVGAGDQVALLDNGGAVVDTISI
jgi:hypothetical protein